MNSTTSTERTQRRSKTVGMLIVLIVAGSAVFAQGFMVKPMRLEMSPAAGDAGDFTIEVRNTLDRAQVVSVGKRVLTQDTSGAWWSAAADSDEGKRLLPSSAVDWLEVTPPRLELGPLEGKLVKVHVQVPRGARGFHAAAIVVQNEPETAAGAVGFVVQFLIPVQIQVQGPPSREKITLLGVDMKHHDYTKDKRGADEAQPPPPTTLAVFQVANEGETFARLSATMRISRQSNGQWRPVADAVVNERNILPSLTLNLITDLRRRLPSGHYKLDAELRVGGRRAGVISKEIDFVGDPAITDIASDVGLTFEPLVEMDAVSGALRTGRINIENPTSQAVKVRCGFDVPKELLGVAIGSVKGLDLDATKWLEVQPAEFNLPGGGKRQIRIIARVPALDSPQPSYYSRLVIGAFYPDGQSAGLSSSLIHLKNPAVPPRFGAQIMNVNLAQQDAAKQSITLRFANVGSDHFTPKADVTVTKTDGQQVAAAAMEMEQALLLPMGIDQASALLDFGPVPAGDYLLRIVLTFGEQKTVRESPIRVAGDEQGKTVSMITPEAPKGTTDATPANE